jgi:hypothetical protein
MSFQWLQMRIGEEKDRREREAQILERLPRAVDELQQNLQECVDAYTGSFGSGAARLTRDGLCLTVANGPASVSVVAAPELPGFEIQREGAPMQVQIGILPGDRLFYLDVSADQYLSMEELTRRVLDRVLFPKLRE